MAIFEIEGPNGELFEIEGAEMPTEAELDEIFASISSSEPSISPSEPVLDDREVLEPEKIEKSLIEASKVPGRVLGKLSDTEASNMLEASALASLDPASRDALVERHLKGSKARGKETLKSLANFIAATPGAVGESVENFFNTFGLSPKAAVARAVPGAAAQEDLPPILGKGIAFEKWETQPVSSLLDMSIVGGIGRAVAKGALKGTQKQIAKKELMSTLGRTEGSALREELLRLSDDILTPEELLIKDHAKGITRIGRRKLDNPNFMTHMAEESQKRLKALAKVDRGRLNKAIRDLGDTPVSKPDIVDDVFKQLDDVELMNRELLEQSLSEGLDVKDAIKSAISEPELAKSGRFVDNMAELLDIEKTLTPAQVRRKMQFIDRAKFSGETETGMKAIRRAYRNHLRQLSPDYDEAATEVFKKLDKYGDDLAKLQRTGSHEKLGKSILSTRAERKEFIEMLSASGSSTAKKAAKDLQLFDDAVAWNLFWDQNHETFTRMVFRAGPFRESVPVNKIISEVQKRKLLGKAKKAAKPKSLRESILSKKRAQAKAADIALDQTEEGGIQ
jgi:hypothetical protein